MNLLNDNDAIYQKLTRALQSLGTVEPALLQDLPILMERHDYSANSLLLNQHQQCRYVWYIIEGYVRWYQLIDNREVTMYISGPDSIVLHEGFYTSKNSPIQLEALKGGCSTMRASHQKVVLYQSTYPTTYKLSTILSNRLHDLKLDFQNNVGQVNISNRYLFLENYLGETYFNSLNTDQIAPLINVGRSTLYRWLHK